MSARSAMSWEYHAANNELKIYRYLRLAFLASLRSFIIRCLNFIFMLIVSGLDRKFCAFLLRSSLLSADAVAVITIYPLCPFCICLKTIIDAFIQRPCTIISLTMRINFLKCARLSAFPLTLQLLLFAAINVVQRTSNKYVKYFHNSMFPCFIYSPHSINGIWANTNGRCFIEWTISCHIYLITFNSIIVFFLFLIILLCHLFPITLLLNAFHFRYIVRLTFESQLIGLHFHFVT